MHLFRTGSRPPGCGARVKGVALAIMVAAASLLTAATSFALGIATDKLNYQPGEKVTIIGQGWQSNESVTLTIADSSGTRERVVIKVSAGATGAFRNSSFVMQESDRDKMLVVTAKGGASGAETMIAFKDTGTSGVLTCSSLTAKENLYFLAPGQTATCSIQGATGLSAAQIAGKAPVEVMVKSTVLGNQAAKVTSVTDDTITFEYSAPAGAFGSSLVSYGPLFACDPYSGRCTTFPSEGNNTGISGGTGAAGFSYSDAPQPTVKALTGDMCYPAPCPGQLKVEKIPQNGSFTSGSQLVFQMVVSNPATVGSAAVTNVRLTDQLPSLGGLVWQNATTTQGSCVNPIVGNALNCTLGTLAPQQSVIVTVTSTATTPQAACVCQANPNAIATADGGLTAYGSGTLNCTTPALIKVVKTPDSGTFVQGGQVKYSIYVSNPGAATINNVQLTDALPTNGGLTWTTSTSSPVGSCSITNNTLNCNIGSIPAGRTVTVTVSSPATTPLEACQPQPNPAAIATADGGLRAQDSGSQSCTPTTIPPQLRVVKTPDNGTFMPGGQLTYTIVVSNPAPAGSAAATNVILSDALPTNGGLTWTFSSTSQGSCSISNNALYCSLGTIAAGASATVTVSTPATTPMTACVSQPNAAAIATADGGLTAQDSGSMTCSTTPPPQLRVVKTPDGGTFTQGGQVRYTILVSNPAPSGSADAMNVRLIDTLPTNGGLTWITATSYPVGSCAITGSTLDCSIPNIPAQRTVTINVYSPSTTPPEACQPQPNAAAIATADGGLTAQDSGSQSCTPSVPPQLRVVKTPDNGTFLPGGQATYTIVVSNPGTAGSATAQDVRLTDSLPTNGGMTWTSFTTTQGICSITNSVLSCTLGNLTPGASATVTVSTPSTTPASACQPQPNTAAIATALGGISAQDSGALTCTPPTPPQLRVVKTPDNGTFPPEGQATYTIVVSNPGAAGSATTQDVRLTDSLPTNGGMTWTSFTTTQGSCSISNSVLSCALGNLTPGASATVTVSTPTTTPLSACQPQPNSAAIATALGGLSAQDSGSLTCTPPAPPQLRVVKTPDNGTFPYTGQATYTIVVSNPGAAGSATTQDVRVTDSLPTNGGITWTSFTTTQGSCSISNSVLSCTLGSLAPGASATITVSTPATTPASACQSQPNSAAIATAQGGLTAQDSGSLTCTPPSPPQLRVVKTPDNGIFTQGGQVTFLIVVSNPAPAGSAAATNVLLNDTLPSNGGLTWSSTSTTQGSCSLSGNVLNCALGTLAAGTSATITVSTPATTPATACVAQPNAAAVASADGGLTAQDSGSVSCTPVLQPQLRVIKTPDGGTFTQGGQATYIIRVGNPAPSGSPDATNVVLTDVLPGNGGLTWTTATPSPVGSCSITANTLRCTIANIPAQRTVTITVSTPATTPPEACQPQPNPAAIATADGGLTARDNGSLTCTPVSTARLGDRVWRDLNGNGIQDCQDTNNNGIIGDAGDIGTECSAGIPGVTVNLVDCQTPTNVLATTQTDATGFYLFPNLTPGQYCVRFNLSTVPGGICSAGVPQFTSANVGTNDAIDSDANPANGITPAVTLAAGQTNRTVDAGVVCAACPVAVDKTCQIQAPPPTQNFVCSNAKPIDSLTMIWTGQSGIYIKAWKGTPGSTLLSTQGPIATGDRVTVSGMGGSPLDQVWEIFSGPPDPLGSNKIGQSQFHISCSDVDMNGPEDCGKLEGNAKTTSTTLINLWRFEGMAGNGQALVCTPTSPTSQDACSIVAGAAPSCQSLGAKPKTLVFRYTGSDCTASSNHQAADKWFCSGVPGTSPVISIVKDPAKITVTPTTALKVGDLVTVSAIGADMGTEVQLQVGGQSVKIHTSCSQPLAVGDVFGSLELVQFNGQGVGAPVIYSYVVRNNGTDTLEITSVTDDKLGELLTQTRTLAAGGTFTVQKSAFVSQTTTNNVTATARIAGTSAVCGQASDQVTVTVTPPAP